MGITKTLVICIIFGFCHGKTKWKAFLSQGNTGRLYMYKHSRYNDGIAGPVCFGNRDYKIPTYNVHADEKDKNLVRKGKKFATMICKELGYGKKARFLGNQEEYSEFLETHFIEGRKPKGKEEALYLKNINNYLVNRHNDSSMISEFTIGGGKCKGNRWDKCEWIDYERVGGNCMVDHSSIFMYCSYKNLRKQKLNELKGNWSSWQEGICPGSCGGNKTLRRYCKRKRGNNPAFCKTTNGWAHYEAKIQNCDPCVILDEYAYNEMYYDSSSSYYSDMYYSNTGHPQPKKKNDIKLNEFNIETQFHCPTGRTFQSKCQLKAKGLPKVRKRQKQNRKPEPNPTPNPKR